MTIRTLFALLLCSALVTAPTFAQDTIVVKTLTFSDITKRSGTWLFPPPQSYEKVLMEYTLKCDPATTQDQYPCGEWDYLTYTMVVDSTGEWDSTARQQVNYVVRNTTPPTFSYTNTPAPVKRSYRDGSVLRTGGSGTFYEVGTGGQNNDLILTPNGGRAQFVWTAAELTAAGLQAGAISGIRIRSLDSVDNVRLFTIRMGSTSGTTIPATINSENLTTVYRSTTNIDDGANDIPFTTQFNWDGTSNIIVELSCLQAPQSIRIVAGGTSAPGRLADGSTKAYSFKAGDVIELPQEVANTISNKITIAFWCWGDATLPRNNNAIEAFNASGQRVLNVHLPWSNANVYWDAGRDASGGPDRIQLPAQEATFKGRWNHWAFVKDVATGTMSMYHNGELFHSEGGKSRPMTGITRFLIGAGNAGNYPGLMDEIQVWSTALTQEEIQQWMNRSITQSHPQINKLEVYLTAENDPSRTRANDASGKGNHAMMFGVPTPVVVAGDELGYLTRNSSGRPQLSFESGAFNATALRTNLIVDGTPELTSVVRYRDNIQPRVYAPNAADHPTIPLDTLLVQEAGWLPIFDETGTKVDSHQVAASQTLTRVNQPWFDPIVNYEIGRFITPYGIGLDLGPNGFKWVFDVTDYAPILRNNVTLSAGNQQELIDITFKFIKGTPPRTVKQIDQLWYDRSAGQQAVIDNTRLEPQTVNLSSEAASFRVKTTTSGHRFDNPTNCSEFCRRIHYITVDNQRTHEWLLWTECGDNPVYPQGGTWLIDRTGWCPGAGVDVYDHEITTHVTPGTAATIDYGLDKAADDDSFGEWVMAGQLFGYGEPNHNLDAAVVDVMRPNNWEFYSRINPICGEPMVIVQNTGATQLTSLTIEYGVVGGSQASSFEWKGALPFLAKDTVVLPIPEWPTQEGAFEFFVRVAKANGATDDYANNNEYITSAVMPPVYYSDLTIRLRTNNQAAAQYQWSLRKASGEVVQEGSNLADNTTYDYPFELENGCYEFELINREGYGLDFWFLRQQLGSGSLAFLDAAGTVKNFEPDFGNRAWIQFVVGTKPTIAASTDTLYFQAPSPQPVTQRVAVTASNDAGLRVDSVSTFSVRQHYSVKETSMSLPATLMPGDTLWVTVEYNREDIGSSNGALRVYCNDERNATYLIRLVGNIGTTSVEEVGSLEGIAEVGVVPNPVTSEGEVVLVVHAPEKLRQVRIIIANVLGETLAVVHDGDVQGADVRYAIPNTLPSGSYMLHTTSTAGAYSVPFVVTR